MAKKRGGGDMDSRLDALLQKMDAVDSGGQGFWSPPAGRSLIRVLPEVGEMEFFFQAVGRHFNLPGNQTEICPNFTTEGDLNCPVCELVRKLYQGSDEDRALAKKLRVSRSYWMNVIVREEKDKGGETGAGPFIFTPGVMIFRAMRSLLTNPEVGEFFDPDSDVGCDLYVDKSGSGIDTRYEVQARRSYTPLHVDEAKEDEWLNAAVDLSYVVLSDDPEEDEERSEGHRVVVLSYHRILEKYGIGPDTDVADVDFESNADEYKASTRRRSQPSEDDPDDELPEEDDEVGAEIRERRRRRRR